GVLQLLDGGPVLDFLRIQRECAGHTAAVGARERLPDVADPDIVLAHSSSKRLQLVRERGRNAGRILLAGCFEDDQRRAYPDGGRLEVGIDVLTGVGVREQRLRGGRRYVAPTAT